MVGTAPTNDQPDSSTPQRPASGGQIRRRTTNRSYAANASSLLAIVISPGVLRGPRNLGTLLHVHQARRSRDAPNVSPDQLVLANPAHLKVQSTPRSRFRIPSVILQITLVKLPQNRQPDGQRNSLREFLPAQSTSLERAQYEALGHRVAPLYTIRSACEIRSEIF